MARPKKQTVDYFTHDCDCLNKKTLYIIESRFGNNGYAFWFKLLEILGATDGHFYDCNDSSAWEFLITKTRLNEVSATEILNMLAKLGAIDEDLWEIRVIWCQNFVNRLIEVYSKRATNMPIKPEKESFRNNKLHLNNVSGEKTNISIVNPLQDDTGNPQIKLKESKVKYSNNMVTPVESIKKNKPEKKHTPEEEILYNEVLEDFQKVYGDMPNYGKEGQHIYCLISRGSKISPGAEREFIRDLIRTLCKLKKTQKDFWKDQPVLPSTINADSIYPRILEHMKQQQADPELLRLIDEIPMKGIG